MVFFLTRMSRFFCLFLFLLAYPVEAQEAVSLLPDMNLTAGGVRSVDVKEICQQGYSKTVRKTSGKLKNKIYKKYGVQKDIQRYKIDHLIPLSIGGSDGEENLWPSPLFPKLMNGHDKDRLEFRLYRMVCHEGYDVQEAQREIQQNWLLSYRNHCLLPNSCPSFSDYMESIGKSLPHNKSRKTYKN